MKCYKKVTTTKYEIFVILLLLSHNCIQFFYLRIQRCPAVVQKCLLIIKQQQQQRCKYYDGQTDK